MRRSCRIICRALALLAVAMPSQAVDITAENPGDYDATLEFVGGQRRYILHVPRLVRFKKPLPLVIVLHGETGNADSAVAMSRMNDAADRRGFMAVYPDGTGRPRSHLLSWNAGECCGYAVSSKVDDVGFLRALINWLEDTRRVDRGAVFAAGMSNGAMMCHRLACELSGSIAAIAPVAGSFTPRECNPARPVSVIMFNGAADRDVPYNGAAGGKTLGKAAVKPVRYSVEYWVKRNGCSTAPITEEKNGFRCDTYGGGQDGTEVVLYTIKGGGHAWPGGARSSAGVHPNMKIDASDIILEFFSRHVRR